MRFYSTNNRNHLVSFREAALQGQPPDKGLYFPEAIPQLSKKFLYGFPGLTKEEIAFELMRIYTGGSIPVEVLQDITAKTVAPDFPLVPVRENLQVLELFHGPTLAFKDVGARFMSLCLGYFMKDANQRLVVLVATSGDTGGAVAHGFYQVEGVEVVILFPAGKVSRLQEAQLTAPGANIKAVEVAGSFDDCQRLVRAAFADKDLNAKLFLTSANSINVARWLPQQLYYFFAFKQWKGNQQPPVMVVPSGNFGNICGGLLARESGLPVKNFIAACNANDTVPRFLQTGNYLPAQTKPTISNAMDVADPSNFVRILELFEQHIPALKKSMTAVSIGEEQTKSVIRRVYDEHRYLLDPHGAVAWAAMEQYLLDHPGEKGIVLGTAHPAKFSDVLEKIIGEPVPVPVRLLPMMQHRKNAVKMPADYRALKDFLLAHAR